MYQLLSYITFLLRSSNQHGVHSPFVYNLVTSCFYNRTAYNDYAKIVSYKSKLAKKSDTIQITDYGSGSKKFKSNERRISDIAKTSGTSLKNTKLLYRMVDYFQPKSILELGTNLGISTHAMALANKTANITSIEGCPELLSLARDHFSKSNLTNITCIEGNFKEELSKLYGTSWDLIFFDGHHAKDATLAYFEMLLPTAHNDTIFIIDDVYWSKGMTEAWQTIKNHPQVTVTVDTFNWGIVFFRKEQLKEHFKIRV